MGFFDNFKGAQYKAELERLEQEYIQLKNSITPEMQDILDHKREIKHILRRDFDKTDCDQVERSVRGVKGA